MKKKLNLVELNKIRALVRNYNTNNSRIELELFEKAKDGQEIIYERRLLLEEKRKLYSGLIPYINPSYDDEYIEYIKGDAKLFNEQTDNKENKIEKQEILDTKVEIIENKILEHRDFINQSIEKIIETRLEEKIQNLSNNETFKLLNTVSKIKVLEKTIVKIKIKLGNLEKLNVKTSTGLLVSNNLLDKKIQTYRIAVEKLEDFKNSIN